VVVGWLVMAAAVVIVGAVSRAAAQYLGEFAAAMAEAIDREMQRLPHERVSVAGFLGRRRVALRCGCWLLLLLLLLLLLEEESVIEHRVACAAVAVTGVAAAAEGAGG